MFLHSAVVNAKWLFDNLQIFALICYRELGTHFVMLAKSLRRQERTVTVTVTGTGGLYHCTPPDSHGDGDSGRKTISPEGQLLRPVVPWYCGIRYYSTTYRRSTYTGLKWWQQSRKISLHQICNHAQTMHHLISLWLIRCTYVKRVQISNMFEDRDRAFMNLTITKMAQQLELASDFLNESYIQFGGYYKVQGHFDDGLGTLN